jgi:ABC-type polysaccharide/polyol phosphate export permease
VLVAPVPRAALVLGKLAGGTVLAVAQAVLFIALAFVLHAAGLAPSLALGFSFLRVLGVLLLLVLMGLGLCGLGYFFAWKLDSSQGFHAIMSVLLFPMWLLSGAFFPAEGSGWLRYIIAANPLTYGVAGLRRLMFPESSAALPSLAICFAVTAAFALVCVVVDAWLTRRSPGT